MLRTAACSSETSPPLQEVTEPPSDNPRLQHTINFIFRQLQPSPTGLYFYFADIPRPADFVFPDLKSRKLRTAVFAVLVGVPFEQDRKSVV